MPRLSLMIRCEPQLNISLSQSLWKECPKCGAANSISAWLSSFAVALAEAIRGMDRGEARPLCHACGYPLWDKPEGKVREAIGFFHDQIVDLDTLERRRFLEKRARVESVIEDEAKQRIREAKGYGKPEYLRLAHCPPPPYLHGIFERSRKFLENKGSSVLKEWASGAGERRMYRDDVDFLYSTLFNRRKKDCLAYYRDKAPMLKDATKKLDGLDIEFLEALRETLDELKQTEKKDWYN